MLKIRIYEKFFCFLLILIKKMISRDGSGLNMLLLKLRKQLTFSILKNMEGVCYS